MISVLAAGALDLQQLHRQSDPQDGEDHLRGSRLPGIQIEAVSLIRDILVLRIRIHGSVTLTNGF
jgi:hypothetical protein